MNDNSYEERVIRPGDTLLVRVPVGTSTAVAQDAKVRLGSSLPGVLVIVIACEQLVVARCGEVVSE